MTNKIAIAIVHGVGKQDGNFHQPMAEELRRRFAALLPKSQADPHSELVIEPIYWAPAIQDAEDELWKRAKRAGDLDFVRLRRFMIDFAGDAIAYQPTPNDRDVYDRIHEIFALTLRKLADDGHADAPLCVIAHSLGTVIASNYIYDLQKDIAPPSVRRVTGGSPLEAGRTLALLYTLGSPIAIWSLRYTNYGTPIQVPSPHLTEHYPALAGKGQWVNFYDKDDVVGFPLKTLNDQYKTAVKRDVEVNAGGLLSSWTPASHTHYWTDNDVTKPIAQSLANLWRAINPATAATPTAPAEAVRRPRRPRRPGH